MGTTVLHRDKGQTSAQFFAEEFGEAYAKSVRATASKPGAFYAVVEVPADEKPLLVPEANGKVRYAWVILTGTGRRSGGGQYEFSYKVQDEFDGPLEIGIPAKLLDMLSPLKDDATAEGPLSWARKWRERCRKRLEMDALLTVGTTFKSPEPITFGKDSFSADTFTVVERRGTKLHFRTPQGYRVRLYAHHIESLKVAA